MKSVLKEIAEKTRQQERKEAEAINTEISDPKTSNDRRNFLKKAAMGGIALGGLMHLSIEDTIAQTTQKVSRSSSPSDLRITDLRVAEKQIGKEMTIANRIIKIYTNQGITGLGDIRDGSDQRDLLALKSKIVGLNPCNVEMIFKVIKQNGYPGRKGGTIAAVEMACWDICGKAFGVPVWLMLGGKYRDKVRLYADTPGGNTQEEQLANLKNRVEVHGFTWLKMDLGIVNKPGAVNNAKFWGQGEFENNSVPFSRSNPLSMETYMSYLYTEGPFTQMQITDKGIEEAAALVESVRNLVGPEIPVSSDHFGYLDENQFIRLCKKIDKYRLAWLEDCFPWFYIERWRRLTEAVETPVLTGEEMYMLNGVKSLETEGCFKTLLDAQAVDIIQPDLCSNGGILETKKVGDYAELVGIPMAIHHNSSPVMFMAGVHCAAATENFLCLEHHNVDRPWWDELVTKTDGQPLWSKGYGNVPLTAPGLGIELNDEAVKARMTKGAKYFEPTPEWDLAGGADQKLWI